MKVKHRKKSKMVLSGLWRTEFVQLELYIEQTADKIFWKLSDSREQTEF